MKDAQILDLYWDRSENAIAETAAKYGPYCYSIAYRILLSGEDADESVNDTYLDAWNCMPPHRPNVLATFLGKITRRISIDRYRARNAQMRGGGEIPLALDELSDCIPAPFTTEEVAEGRALVRAINAFLSGLPDTERDVFVCRYWFLAPVKEIAERCGMGQGNVKSMLHRTRKKLAAYLEKEGF